MSTSPKPELTELRVEEILVVHNVRKRSVNRPIRTLTLPSKVDSMALGELSGRLPWCRRP